MNQPALFFFSPRKGKDPDTAFYANLVFPVKIFEGEVDFKEYLM